MEDGNYGSIFLYGEAAKAGMSKAVVCIASLLLPCGTCLLVGVFIYGADKTLELAASLLSSSSVLISCAVLNICEALSLLMESKKAYLFDKKIVVFGVALPLLFACFLMLVGTCLYSVEQAQGIFEGLAKLRNSQMFAIYVFASIVLISLMAGYCKMCKCICDGKRRSEVIG